LDAVIGSCQNCITFINEKPVKVLHLATQDMAGGGGGFDGAYRLHRNMRLAGIDSRMVVMKRLSDDPYVVDVMNQLTLADKLRLMWCAVLDRYKRRRFKTSNYFIEISQERMSASQLLTMLPFQPDVIIAHWVSNFVTAGTLRDLNRMTLAPIIWYFMDMAPLTGGCHYAFDCTGYTRQCGNCPQLGAGRGAQDLSHRQWCSKWANLQETNITAVAASSWLQSQLEAGSIFRNKRHEKILLAVDPQIFCPVPREQARKQLNLPADRKIIFFGANRLHEERKGIRYLLGALRLLHVMLADNVALRDQILVVMAGGTGNSALLDIPFEHQYLGFLMGDVMLASGYQAADVFVNASIEDAGPMMINESILCGTLVVSFEMGVAVDLVHTDRTGYRARLKDEQDMAAGLRRILELNDEACHEMRERCRNYGLQMCHPDVQVRAFESLCSELIASNKTRNL
jgi:glycosyltransferase involved in cell wall biosynthesis